jgi:type VI secretion system ImpA family protein
VSAGPFDGLLDPIPGPAPAGEALRWGPVHAEIEESRREEDDGLPRGVWRRDLKHADLERTVALCRAALAQRSKDLQIACWLTEAVARLHGPGAAAEGLGFIGALCGSFWPGLHPAHDGEPDSPRFAPLVWLDGALATLVSTMPVVEGETDAGPAAMGWSDVAAARRRDAARRGTKASRASRDWPTVERFEALAERTPRAPLEALVSGCAALEAAAGALEATLAGLAGETAPGLSRLRAALRDVLGLARPILARKPAPAAPPFAAPPEPSEPFAAEIAMMSEAIDPTPRGAAPSDREAAYRALAEIAAFLRRVEPHSPTPYLIERAVRWGGMSLPELMADLSRQGRDDLLKWLLEGSDKR